MCKEKILEGLNERGEKLFNDLAKTMEWGLDGLSNIPKVNTESMKIEEIEKCIENYYTFTEAGLRNFMF